MTDLPFERAIVIDTTSELFAGMAEGPAFHFGQRVRYYMYGEWFPRTVSGMTYDTDRGWQYRLNDFWVDECELDTLEEDHVDE